MSDLITKLYGGLLSNVILPFGDLVTGSSVMSSLKEWRKIGKKSEEEIDKIATDNLRQLLRFAVDNVPYYKDYNSFESGDVYEWLSHFPVMRKSDIKNNLDSLLTEDKSKLIKFSSSGSSGVQGSIYMNKLELSRNRALNLFIWESVGYKIGMNILQTGMTSNRGFVKGIKDKLFLTDYVVAFNLSENSVISILNRYRGKKSDLFCGYASSLGVYAEIALKNNIRDVRFDLAISWGDKLFDKYKRNIYDAFGCKVYETYGCSEGLIVGIKADLDYFYIMSPHIHIEIVDIDGNPVPDGEMGYVLLTRLDGFSMPLIRYYVGDLAIKLPKEKYPDDRKMYFPLLERVIGRDTDVVKTESGKSMIVHFFTGIFEYCPEIKQFRVIQRDKDKMEIEYIVDINFSFEVLRKIEKIIWEHLQEEFPIEWKEVDFIPATPSGKPQIIQSFIK